MDDLLFTMKRESRALQELRKDIQAIWVDAVARELNGRYLNPHEGDDQQMLAALNRQKDVLDQARIRLDSAQTCARQAENHAATVIESLQSVEQERDKAGNEYERYRHYDSEARSRLPIIQGWIDQANSACDSGRSIGSFATWNWEGYPNGPKPSGAFRILERGEYEAARKEANEVNRAMHQANPSLKGLQIHEIHPVKFGGSPTDPTNKIALTPSEHAKYTTWWNKRLAIMSQG
jgi:hypothetical protein